MTERFRCLDWRWVMSVCEKQFDERLLSDAEERRNGGRALELESVAAEQVRVSREAQTGLSRLQSICVRHGPVHHVCLQRIRC